MWKEGVQPGRVFHTFQTTATLCLVWMTILLQQGNGMSIPWRTNAVHGQDGRRFQGFPMTLQSEVPKRKSRRRRQQQRRQHHQQPNVRQQNHEHEAQPQHQEERREPKRRRMFVQSRLDLPSPAPTTYIQHNLFHPKGPTQSSDGGGRSGNESDGEDGSDSSGDGGNSGNGKNDRGTNGRTGGGSNNTNGSGSGSRSSGGNNSGDGRGGRSRNISGRDEDDATRRHIKKPNEHHVENPDDEPDFSRSPSVAPSAKPSTVSGKPRNQPESPATEAPTQTATEAPTQSPTQTPSQSPTQTPTQSPTQTPTQSPTQTPTQTPTQRSTKTPIEMPTQAPTQTTMEATTQSPTQVATQSPTQGTTQSPTQGTTQSPTQGTTQSPTQGTTQSPTQGTTHSPTQGTTQSPTQGTTQSPTQGTTQSTTQGTTQSPTQGTTQSPTSQADGRSADDCAASSEGFFGSTVSTSTVDLSYAYELVTTAQNATVVQDEVLPSLESQITDNLLPLFFQECADTPVRRLQPIFFELPARRQLEVAAVSSLPKDSVVPGESCDATVSGERCDVVSGKLTLFVNGDEVDDEKIALDGIRSGMENNAFLEAHPSIVRIVYVNGTASAPERGTDIRAVDPEANGTSTLGAYNYVLIAGAALLLVFGLFLCTRLITTKNDEEIDERRWVDEDSSKDRHAYDDNSEERGIAGVESGDASSLTPNQSTDPTADVTADHGMITDTQSEQSDVQSSLSGSYPIPSTYRSAAFPSSGYRPGGSPSSAFTQIRATW